MRIRRVRMDSFGALRDRSYDMSPGLTVFHGPNESGKSTTMEFIRTLTAPSNKRNQYPERSTSDSGAMEYEEDGSVRTVTLKGKSRAGDIPEMPNGTGEPELYRKVFAMDPEGLDDHGSVDELKSRFLTVPGGARMPAALASCEDACDRTLGKRSNSRSRVNSKDAEMSTVQARIAAARAEADRYGELSARLESLEARSKQLDEESRASLEDRRVRELYESQRGNYARLETLRADLAGLGDFTRVTGEDERRHRELADALHVSEGSCRSYDEQKAECTKGMMGAEPKAVLAHYDEIESVQERLEGYRADVRSVSAPSEPEQVTRSVRRTNPMAFIGAAVAVAGLIGCYVSLYSLAITAAGAALAVIGLLRPVYDDVVDHVSHERRPDPEVLRRIASFEADVSSLMDSIGLVRRGPVPDANLLIQVRGAAGTYRKLDQSSMRHRLNRNQAELEMSRFESRYGGEEGYRDCVQRTSRASRIESEIAAIEGAIRSAGLDPASPECPAGEVDDTLSGERDSVNREIGSVRQAMRGILDDGELDRLMDRREGIKAELAEALTDGAVALLASTIARDACEDAYSSVQPGVVATADRYLSMMTGGRYTLDVSPLSERLSVRSAEGTKEIGQWSSGLRAQVLLSVKLAIAREMGDGRVPVILDDVLLPFDSARKEGACRALAELSSEMQVLLFTCDAETAGICRGIPGVSVVPM